MSDYTRHMACRAGYPQKLRTINLLVRCCGPPNEDGLPYGRGASGIGLRKASSPRHNRVGGFSNPSPSSEESANFRYLTAGQV
jgi:hypothetical protein